MSVEAIDTEKKLVPWEPKFELFGFALEGSHEDDVCEVRLATQVERDHFRYYSRTPA